MGTAEPRGFGMQGQGTRGHQGKADPLPHIPTPQGVEAAVPEGEQPAAGTRSQGRPQQPMPLILCTFQRERRAAGRGGSRGGYRTPCHPLPLPQGPATSSCAATSSRHWSWCPTAPRPRQVGPPTPPRHPGPPQQAPRGADGGCRSRRPRRPRVLRARQPEHPGARPHPGPTLGPGAALPPGAALRGPPGGPRRAPGRGGGGV